MRKVITAAVFFFIFFFLKDYYRNSEFSIIFVAGFYVSIIYLIVAVINYLRAPHTVNTTPVNERKSSGSRPGCFLIGGLGGAAVLVYFMNESLGRYSFRTFVLIDRLLNIMDSLPPFVAWGILGLMVGSVYGSIVAWKKYHLNFSVNLIPLGVLILIVGSLFMINRPMAYSADGKIDPGNGERLQKDGSSLAKQLIVRRWKVVDVKGKNRDSFLKQHKNKKNCLDFKENGKCYLSENGVVTTFFYYTVADDGKSFTFTEPKQNSEKKLINIISLSKDELVIKTEIFQNDTAILKPDE